MLSPLERMIALRYLRARRKEGFISVNAAFSFIGIMLGVSTLIVVMAVMNGFRDEITSKILGFNGHINVTSLQSSLITDYDKLAKQIDDLDQVTEVVPIINKQVMVTTDYNTLGALVQGVSAEDLQKKSMVVNHITEGSLEDFKQVNGIILGVHLARNLGVRVGDSIKLLSPGGSSTVLGTIPRIKTYSVSAIFEAGMYEYDNTLIFMPLPAAQLFFKLPGAVNSIEVTTDNAQHSQPVVENIIQATQGGYLVQDWQMLNATLFNALKVERTVMFLILTLIVCIAAFNIVSSLIMLVNDKRKDIAILRTMGATRQTILWIFLMSGAMIGVVGTLAGFILGISFASNIETIRRWLESLTGHALFDPVLYFLSELPAKVQTEDVVLSVGMGIGLSLLATIYPALKAARQEPVEVLRYE